MIRVHLPRLFLAVSSPLLPAGAVLMAMGCQGRTSLSSRAGQAPGGSRETGGALGGVSGQREGGASGSSGPGKPGDRGGSLQLLAGGLGGGDGFLDGVGAAARFYRPSAVAGDGAGNLFVADNHTVRRVVIATAEVTTVAGSPGQAGSADGRGTAARFNGPYGVAPDGAGGLFVADTSNHTIRRVVIATGEVTTIAGSPGQAGSADGPGVAARFNNPYGIAADGAGNLLVTDSSNHTVRRVVIATGEVKTLAGSSGKPGSADGVGAAARFVFPTGVTGDRAGQVFVVDTYNHAVRKVVIATGEVTTVAAIPQRTPDSDGYLPEVHGDVPQGIVGDEAGNLFVVDALNEMIWKVVMATGGVTALAGSPRQWGSSDGRGADARFLSPYGVTTDGAGNLFVADSHNHSIRKAVIATGEVTTFAGLPDRPGSTDGTGAAARFHYPHGVASDREGNLFVADSSNNTVRKIIVATGEVTTLAGSPERVGGDDGVGAAARFYSPYGIVTDGAGDLFVADEGNATVRKIAIATGEVTTVAGSQDARGSRDGIGPSARFSRPSCIASDGAGNLFVADTGNHTIRKVVIATGEVSTVAGLPEQRGNSDGIGAAARFYSPQGVACDGAGNLFVADTYNHTIRKIVIAMGEVTTLVGSPGNRGSSEGVGSAARFDSPQGVACDGAGNLLVADTGNHTIRKIVVSTRTVTTVVGTPDRAGVALGPLPAGLAAPSALALGPAGQLFISDAGENAILVVTF